MSTLKKINFIMEFSISSLVDLDVNGKEDREGYSWKKGGVMRTSNPALSTWGGSRCQCKEDREGYCWRKECKRNSKPALFTSKLQWRKDVTGVLYMQGTLLKSIMYLNFNQEEFLLLFLGPIYCGSIIYFATSWFRKDVALYSVQK